MYTYHDIYESATGMHKRATGWLTETLNAAGNVGALYAAYTVAASLVTGTAIGWGAAKLSTPSAQDKETIRKAYDNERLKSDIGYMKERLRSEKELKDLNAAQANKKSIRIFE